MMRAVFAAPALDEVHVGARSDAQLDGTFTSCGLRPRVMPSEALAGEPRQQVRPTSSDLGEFSESGCLALGCRWTIDGIPAAYVRDLRQQIIISPGCSHLNTIEHEFE